MYTVGNVPPPGNYDVKWKKAGAGSYFDFGSQQEVDPSGVVIVTKDIKIGSVGDVKLGKWIIALDGTIMTQVREVTLASFRELNPWWTTGDILFNPATWHKDVYDYAGALVLHPNDVADPTMDLIFFKAYPIFKPRKRDGAADEFQPITWEFFPDRTQLTTGGSLLLSYGRIGGTAP